ncbi:MAG: hypothetical protein U0325_13010 [Polyangiales bacterium]
MRGNPPPANDAAAPDSPGTAPRAARGLALVRVGLAALVLAVYAPHLDGDFISDDREYLRDDPRLTAPDGARRLLTEAFARGTVYRPVSTLTFWAQARAQGMAVAPLRAGNVVVHLAAVQMLLSLLLRLGSGLGAAGMAAALFAVHPGVTEPVMFIAARNDAMGALFIALAVWWALAAPTSPPARARRVAGAALAAALAMGCKEPFAVAPLLLALTPWITPDGGDVRARARRSSRSRSAPARW